MGMPVQRGVGRIAGLVLIVACAAALGNSRAVAASAEQEWARQILDATGTAGGLVVQLGSGDGKLTAALRAGDSYLVHGLDANAENVEKARAYVQSLGLYGPVSFDRLRGIELPYDDDLVRLVVVEDPSGVPMEEIMRVLAPGGAAYVKNGDGWSKTVNPRPEDIDTWSHYLHDASGNAVARDEEIGPPEHLRWIAGPRYGRSHEFNPSLNALVTAGGRMFYLFDEGTTGLVDNPHYRFPSRWMLVARDASSGVLLWKRPVHGWGYREWNTVGMWSAPLTLNRRIVTDGGRVFVTLGYKAPVTVLDAATGDEIRTLPETDGTDEMVLADGVLVACVREQLSVASPPGPNQKPKRRLNPHEYSIGPPGPAAVVAIDAASGVVLWRRDPGPVTVLTLAADGRRVCFDGDGELVCLDLSTGKEQWTAPCGRQGGSRHSGGTLVMHDGVVLFTSGEGLVAFSAADGQKLWSGPKVSGPGITHPPDLFVADGLVWGGDEPGMGGRERTEVIRHGRDLLTGEVKRTVDVPFLFSPLHHVRCYRSKATDRYLLLTKRGVEFVDLRGENHGRNDWLRATCHYGFLPANGLLYIPPHHCFCYPGVKMHGFLALTGASGEGRGASGEQDPAERLERGPAFDQIQNPPSTIHDPSAWPTYRRDPVRTGSTPATVPTSVGPAWQTALGGKLTPPVLAGGKLFVAQPDAQTVHALAADDGAKVWSFTAGGRVDSPPTIHEGLVLFGCGDGWVYCLRAADGALSWRFRAAPEERRIVAEERLESPWPVAGSVLVLDGTAYVCAGRSSFLDGGVRLYGLDPRTGDVVCQTCVEGPQSDVEKDVGRPFDMDGVKGDVLVTDAAGENIYLYQMTFDKRLRQVATPRASNLGDRKTGRHLVATGGFVDDSWFDRNFWAYWDRWPGFYFADKAPKAGQILVFDDATTYGLHVFTSRARLSPFFTPGTGYELFADADDNEPVLPSGSADREKGPGFSRTQPSKWSVKIPLRVRAMVLARQTLFMAGPPDVVPKDDPYAAFDGRLGAQLWAVSTADGHKLAEQKLDALPVFDGLIATEGKLYLSTADGKVRCFADKP